MLKDLKLKDIIMLDEEILKDDNRSLVKVVNVKGEKIVVKQPREKNRRKWIRFWTLFRDSEVKKEFESMMFLKKNLIKGLEPIKYEEIKKMGMVVDSYLLYRYQEGVTSDKNDISEIIKIIKKIHKLGYLHGDAQFRNFIKSPEGKIVVIDFKVKKKLLGKFSEAFEYIVLENSVGEIDKEINFIKNTNYYKLAKFFNDFFREIRKIKKKIRVWRK
ncbi:MAG: hypothetical protein B6I28_04085 [Fusobacteriia bacterium 4572_132]|nr:MAG: hypothetical protein B6I28_04085 [Fusobacteriia bacterium 4572_132]